MSLTSLISQDKELRNKIKSLFSLSKLDKTKLLIAEPMTKRYALMGIAFDYIFRFNLEKINDRKTVLKPWIAEQAVARLNPYDDSYQIGMDIINEVKYLKNEFIKKGEISEDLIKQTIRMSYLDAIIRSGTGHEYIGIDADYNDVIDIMNLYKLINDDTFSARHICLLNPTFGAASSLVGGADADFIIDDKLVDIKTTKKIELNINNLSQIVCYFALNKINKNINGDINEIGVYYSRFGYLFLFNIMDAVESESILNEFISWFEERIKKPIK